MRKNSERKSDRQLKAISKSSNKEEGLINSEQKTEVIHKGREKKEQRKAEKKTVDHEQKTGIDPRGRQTQEGQNEHKRQK